jgi:hypothetical protein
LLSVDMGMVGWLDRDGWMGAVLSHSLGWRGQRRKASAGILIFIAVGVHQ